MNKFNPLCITILFFLVFTNVSAQEGTQSYQFLNLSTSTRANALGGTNVSVIDNDLSLVFENPAALGPEMDMNLNVNYMAYIAGIGLGSAMFGKALTNVSAFAVGVNYMNYGTFDGTTAENVNTGTFTAQDIALNAVYSRELSPSLRGGVTTKFLYSSYDIYTSMAIGFDAGLSYYNRESNFSAGLVLKNMGTQLTSYNQERVRLPWDVQFGITQKLSHAPIQFSLTSDYLTQWNFSAINAANGIAPNNSSFISTAFKHLVFGVDILPTDNVWISAGYNPKVHSDMKLTTGNTFGGWSMGAGIRVNKFNIGASVSSYSKSAASYHFSVGMDLRKY